MKKIFIIFFILLVHSVGYSNELSYEQQLAEKGVNIVRSPVVDTSFPAWLQPGYNETIAHWLRVLPFPGDRYEDAYIVIPRLGLIAPIQQPGPTVTYKNFDYNTLLESGLVLYPNRDGDLGGIGNSVMFGHSSNLTYKQGRYKTIFSVLPLLDKGDQIWLFKKDFGNFELYKYHVLQSYETNPYDGFVTQSSTRKIITLFTCSDIGTTDNRWLIKAEQMQGDIYVPYNHSTGSQQQIPQETPTISTPDAVRSRSSYITEEQELDSIFDTFE